MVKTFSVQKIVSVWLVRVNSIFTKYQVQVFSIQSLIENVIEHDTSWKMKLDVLTSNTDNRTLNAISCRTTVFFFITKNIKSSFSLQRCSCYLVKLLLENIEYHSEQKRSEHLKIFNGIVRKPSVLYALITLYRHDNIVWRCLLWVDERTFYRSLNKSEAFCQMVW